MQSMNATEARKNFQHIINTVHYTKELFVITKRGKPWVKVEPLGNDVSSKPFTLTKNSRKIKK